MVAVAVDRLLAEQNQIRLFGLDDRFERERDQTAVEIGVVRFDANRAVGTGGQGGAQHGLALLGTERDDDHLTFALFGGLAIFGQAQRGLERVLVERVGLPLETGGLDRVTRWADFDLVGVVGIGNALQCNQDFHCLFSSRPFGRGSRVY